MIIQSDASLSHTHAFRSIAMTFKSTTEGVLHNLALSIELMQRREDVWKIKYEKVRRVDRCSNRILSVACAQELERRRKFQDLYCKIANQKIPSLGCPDAEVRSDLLRSFAASSLLHSQEGPHSSLKDEEFFDALDQSLDRIDRDNDHRQRSVNILRSQFLRLERRNFERDS